MKIRMSIVCITVWLAAMRTMWKTEAARVKKRGYSLFSNLLLKESCLQIYTKMERMANSDSRCAFSSCTYIDILYPTATPYMIFIFFKERQINKG